MKHTERMSFRKRALLKPLACMAVAVPAVCIAPIASATWNANPSGDIVWCNGDSKPDALTYKDIWNYPADTLPFGYIASDPRHGLNPADTWDAWMSGPFNNPPIGDKLETMAPYTYPAMAYDNYAVQLNYWNSVRNGSATKSPFGHSSGRSCLTYTDYTNALTPGLQFTISYPADASQPDNRTKAVNGVMGEVEFLNKNPNRYPNFAPFKDGITVGGPTGYVSTFKGCSWDANSCTRGSKIPVGNESVVKSPDINKFPEKLSDITSILTSWSIDADYRFGNPFELPQDASKGIFQNDRPQIWDASWDIWFDKTARTNEGQAPYDAVRGQNDGLEIMIWMNSRGSYVDDYDGRGQPHGSAGRIQPVGSIREQAMIDGVLYDVWVGRLNNPYFGYTTGNVVAPGDVPGSCPGTINNATDTYDGRKNATLCGVEWNVVSFVATKAFYSGQGGSGVVDYRKNSNSINARSFTDYLLGLNRLVRAPGDTGSDWTVTLEADANGTLGLPASQHRLFNHERLLCPASNKEQGIPRDANKNPTGPFGGQFGTSDCLDPSWYLMSVQAGFETWSGGNGLKTNKFRAYVNTEATVNNARELDPRGYPIINGGPMSVIYPECKKVDAKNTASLSITGKNQAGVAETIGPYNLLPQLYDGHFESYPGVTDLVGDANIHVTSNCGKTVDIPVVIIQGSTTPGVTVALTLNGADWQNGYCRNLVVTNTNNYPVTWTVNFTLPFVGKVDPNNNWNLTYKQTGNNVTASGKGWNNVLQPHQTINQQGFCASK